jgi:hypothetical protein
LWRILNISAKQGWVPIADEQLFNCTPHKFGEGAREEDVIIILHLLAKGTQTCGGAVRLRMFSLDGRCFVTSYQRKI